MMIGSFTATMIRIHVQFFPYSSINREDIDVQNFPILFVYNYPDRYKRMCYLCSNGWFLWALIQRQHLATATVISSHLICPRKYAYTGKQINTWRECTHWVTGCALIIKNYYIMCIITQIVVPITPKFVFVLTKFGKTQTLIFLQLEITVHYIKKMFRHEWLYRISRNISRLACSYSKWLALAKIGMHVHMHIVTYQSTSSINRSSSL